MLPGPTIIRRCSACRKLIAQHTTLTGNTFGARRWTDGKLEAPMRPDRPSLVLCPHCKDPVWIEELEEVGVVGSPRRPAPKPSTIKSARPPVEPKPADYFGLLSKGSFELKKERYLRRKAWWTGNDQRRRQKLDTPLSSEETVNLVAFATLLNEANEVERLMKAEVMRELGRFVEAKTLLDHPFSKVASSAVQAIGSLVEQHDCFVREVSLK